MSRGHTRTRRITVRLSEIEYRGLVGRAAASGAKTAAAYLRAAALTGREFEMPPWQHLRDLRNAVISANHARDLPALIDALERISRF